MAKNVTILSVCTNIFGVFIKYYVGGYPQLRGGPYTVKLHINKRINNYGYAICTPSVINI